MSAALTAFLVAFVLTPLVRAAGRRWKLLDVPNERSSHAVPTPRGGGIAVVCGVAVALTAQGVWRAPSVLVPATAALGIALLGLLDDVRGIPQWTRLATQTAAAMLVIMAGRLLIETIELPLLDELRLFPAAAVALSLFWIVGSTNAFNFMDGINGIAAVEAIVCATALAILCWRTGDVVGAKVSLAVAGAAAGFLPWNFPSGSIFMGDVGSATLGFLLAILVIRASKGGTPLIAAALPLLPFLFDTTVTLVRRILKREPILSAHRSHFYQLLTISGWSHTRVTILWGSLAAACAASAIVYGSMGDLTRAAVVVTLLAVHAAVALFAYRRAGRAR